MSEMDFWTAEFEGTEKQVAYAKYVRDFVSYCLDWVYKSAINFGNSADDADAIKQAIIDGIVEDVRTHGGIEDGKIYAGKFLDSVLPAFPLMELMGGRHSFTSMKASNLVAYAKLGGYSDLVIYNSGCVDYLVAGHAKLEKERNK